MENLMYLQKMHQNMIMPHINISTPKPEKQTFTNLQQRTSFTLNEMAKALVLLQLVVVSLLVNQGKASENQRLFNNAVIRVQHLHQLAAKMITDFEESLLPDERRQLSKIFPLSFCNSDSIEAPTGKDEAQKSSMLKLLRISFRLIEAWEFPSQTLSTTVLNSVTVGNPNQIYEKLADLKMGISVLIKGCLDGQPNMDDNDSLPQLFEDFYLTAGDSNLRENFRLLACFKKDMHKVETYLRVANCRRSPDSNCTL